MFYTVVLMYSIYMPGICLIYEGEVPVLPLFGLRGTVPHFSGQKVKNLLSPVVNRGDLRRLNYYKIAFGRCSARTPLGDLTTLSQTPESDEEGILPSYSPSLSRRDPRASHSPSELVPRLFRPKLRP